MKTVLKGEKILHNNKELLFFFLVTALVSFPLSATAKLFCIHNQDELIQAFAIASGNSEDDILSIVQGESFNDTKLPSEPGYLIKIKTSLSSDCTDILDISQTVAKVELTSQESEELAEPMQSTTGPIPPEGTEFKVEKLSAISLAENIDTTVLGVPQYSWYRGCGPTAVGMVVAYWDQSECNDLYDGNAATQTDSVNLGMASPAHYSDYSLPIDSSGILPDKSEPPAGDEHISNSIADFMFTSWSSQDNRYGWSWSNHIKQSFTNYANYRNSNYSPSTDTYYFEDYSPQLTWDVLTLEIDAKRPMVFLVDTDGNGGTDHFVTIVGYRLEDGVQQYGCHDTWDTSSIRWEDFRGIAPGSAWGIYCGYSFQLSCPTSAPSTWPVSIPIFLLLKTDN